MKRNLHSLFLFIFFPLISKSQSALTVDGVNTHTYSVSRVSPIKLTVKRSLFVSGANEGYLLVAGDDTYVGARDNHLDGAKIIGNKFVWNGYEEFPGSILHGILVGMNKNQVVKHNFTDGVPYSIVYKSANDEPMESTSGGHSYNIHRNSKTLNIKGMSGVKIYNNTFYNTRYSSFYNIHIYENNSSGEVEPYTPSKNVKIKNNIIYQKYDIPAIDVAQNTCLEGFESDYNVYWCEECEDNKPSFEINGVSLTWEEWKALGYDTHSHILNPNFIDTMFLVPAARIDYGTNLGIDFEYGLGPFATWNVGHYPDTVRQNGLWQIGAVIYENHSGMVYVNGIAVTGAEGVSDITSDHGTLQLNAAITPVNATSQTVTWSIVEGKDLAIINNEGLVTARSNGTIVVRATAGDGTGVFGELTITISNQSGGADNYNPVGKIIVNAVGITIMLSDNFAFWKAGLYNLQGSLLANQIVDSDILIFNDIQLSPGIYFVVLSNGKKLRTAKLVIL
jgi:hypothetical protein